jgi:CheY-like chemotaxis protein
MEKMLGRLIGEKYKIDLNCPDELPSIFADEGGLAQVLTNLVLNARDSMPDGGVIHIETGLSVLDEATQASHREARAGRFVWLLVSDHGCGMGPQVLARIFDPFFTTKGVGKGTGLGLSTIHGIVKQHEGWIDVTSQVGLGSAFKLFLPAGDKPACSPATTSAEDDSASEAGRGETVLVVEDEPAVRELACAALKSQGYQVIKAADGPDAVQIWEHCSEQIDLLLTDMVMPSGMSGDVLAKTLQSRNPRLRVIYTSGYTPEFMQKDSPLPREINFLPKPYDLHTLFKAVRLCLDGGTLGRVEPRPPRTEEALAAD